MNTLTAKSVTITSLAGQRKVTENAFGRDLGFFEVVKGFAHFTGYANTAAEGVTAVVRGGHDGLVKALAEGLVNGRDDRQIFRYHSLTCVCKYCLSLDEHLDQGDIDLHFL